MKRRLCALWMLLLSLLLLTGCGQKEDVLQDGYYTAQAAEYSYGWKEYVTIMVKNGLIVSIEYNAENASGFIKSWDNAYMQNMLPISGTYPNEYTRYYSGQLLGTDGDVSVDMITGATSSWNVFQKLIIAVREQARQGDPSIVIVPTQAD